jgi:hypothetical protein
MRSTRRPQNNNVSAFTIARVLSSPENADGWNISQQFKKTGKRFGGIEVATPGPSYELRHIHTPVGRLAVEDPALRLFHSLAQISLRQPGFLSQSSQEGRQWLVCRSVLGLGSQGAGPPL